MASDTQQLSTFEVDGHVARITLNRPEAMNSLNPELRWELSQHYDEVERNDDIWLAVVTGAGERAFCAGADLKHRALEREADSSQRAHWDKLAGETKSLIERWHFSETRHRAGQWVRAWRRIGTGACLRHHCRRRSC